MVSVVVLAVLLSVTWAQSAVEALQSRAQGGDAAAQAELAFRYRTGQGVAKDLARALDLYHRAAKQGEVSAYYNLGTMYYNGDGTAFDDVAACRWFTIAADAGDPTAPGALQRAERELTPEQLLRCHISTGDAYITGTEIKADYPRGLQIFQKLAGEGNAEAAYRIGIVYSLGLGVAKDAGESTRWILRSAEGKHAPAYLLLAEAYENGTGIAADPVLALKYYKLAANAGFPKAMAALGRMYLEGRGTAPNKQEACAWYVIAAAAGDHDAQRSVRALTAELGKKGTEKAYRKARDIRARLRIVPATGFLKQERPKK